MGKHRGKGVRRSAAERRKEDARWMKLISKDEVISTLFGGAGAAAATLIAQVSHCSPCKA